jgi:hypothetical protein
MCFTRANSATKFVRSFQQNSIRHRLWFTFTSHIPHVCKYAEFLLRWNACMHVYLYIWKNELLIRQRMYCIWRAVFFIKKTSTDCGRCNMSLSIVSVPDLDWPRSAAQLHRRRQAGGLGDSHPHVRCSCPLFPWQEQIRSRSGLLYRADKMISGN